MAKKKSNASAQYFPGGKQSSLARRVRQALGLSVALACSAQAGAADESLIARAFAEQASYLAREALSYEHGEGVPRDQAYAARLYCESARLGEPEGMYAIGWMYANGRGVERNDEYAATLLFFFAMSLYGRCGSETPEPDTRLQQCGRVVAGFHVREYAARSEFSKQLGQRHLEVFAVRHGRDDGVGHRQRVPGLERHAVLVLGLTFKENCPDLQQQGHRRDP